MANKKKLLIKVSTIFKPRFGNINYVSGIGRSTYMLLRSIAQQNNLPYKIALYGAGISSIHGRAKDLPFDYTCFPLPMKLGTDLTRLEPFYLNHIQKADLLHIPHNYDYALSKDMHFTVTMHDTCEYDTAVERHHKDRMDVWKLSAKYSKKIVTCSESSKNDIIDRFGVPEHKIVVIPWGISFDLFQRVEKKKLNMVLNKFSINEPYFFVVSCFSERKNVAKLLEAYGKFSENRSNPNIVLIWNEPPSHILSRYSREIENGKIKFIKYVSDDELVSLYSGALATLFPSRYEGFGFPVLESFACGTPVMTCRNSSLPEVGGDLAVYVDEDSIDEMVQAMEMFANSQFDIESFQGKLREHLSKFSWTKAANSYIDFFDEVMNS